MMPGALAAATVTITEPTFRDGAMTNTGKSSTLPQVRTGPLVSGGVLIAVGGLIALAGFVIGGAHLLAATRQWVREMDVPPGEVAKLKLAQARAAATAGAAAGADAWQNGPAGARPS
jgi:hypothetical protein